MALSGRVWTCDEHHDLPNTQHRVSRWLEVFRRADGAILLKEHATSRATGCDLPTEVVEMILP